MKNKYISCDGSLVEEEVVSVDFRKSLLPPHNLFVNCKRTTGDSFEIYDFEDIKYIKE